PRSLRPGAGSLTVRHVPDAVAAVPEAVREALGREGSIGVIVPDSAVPAVSAVLDGAAELGGGESPASDYGSGPGSLGGSGDSAADDRVLVVPATLAKGLEYDHVILVEPADIVTAEDRGLARLYVVLTRA